MRISPRSKLAGVIVCASFCALLLVLICLRAAARRAPAFYDTALSADPQLMRQASNELLASATAIVNTSHRSGAWHATLTEEQINGWLSVDLQENYPDLLPRSISQPRIHLDAGCATIACRYESSTFNTVASVSFDAYLSSPRVLALRIRSVRAGALPMPIKPILDGIVETVERLNLPLQWRQKDGDPVALITLPAAHEGKASYQLDSLRLHAGKLVVAGRTEAIGAPGSPSPSSQPPRQPDVASLPDENRKTQ